MKILNSHYHNSEWNNLKVVSLKLCDLWASVPRTTVLRGKIFYDNVKQDIVENGLRFPLLVVDAKRSDILKQKARYKNKLCSLPFDEKTEDLSVGQYAIWGGSNRFCIARELGYDAIDCVIIGNSDFALAKSMQKLHRSPYAKKFYES
jgi:hypothetical protein